jgi:hypothetical protein
MVAEVNLRERLAWLLELAPPEPTVPCPELGPVSAATCSDTQDHGAVRACNGCPVGAALLAPVGVGDRR